VKQLIDGIMSEAEAIITGRLARFAVAGRVAEPAE